MIVTDYQMPKMTGEEFCRHLRTGKLNSETPVIFCTAKGYEIDHEFLASELRVERIFQKPFSPRELVSIINDVLAPNSLRS